MLVFVGYRTIIARYVAKRGIAQMCLCETKYQGGIAPLWGSANLPGKVSRSMGYRSDSVAVSRDMVPLLKARKTVLKRPRPTNKLASLGLTRNLQLKLHTRELATQAASKDAAHLILCACVNVICLVWGRRSGGVKSASVSQSVGETGRDESQSVASPEDQ